MIEIHEKFRIRPKCMKQAVTLGKEMQQWAKGDAVKIKVLTDAAADFYTLYFIVEAESFDSFLVTNKKVYATDEWKTWYERFRVCVIEGRREIYNVE